MKCDCGGDTHVVNSRPWKNLYIIRRRECLKCEGRFTTKEYRDEDPPIVSLTPEERLAKIKALSSFY